ncbi:MAG TPA: phytochelatin synthase, partial [Cyanobacteria bacterium UBA11149]|nr:phytochelatin synthase [Cyanobacteria bacterium UBA11149]
TTVDDVPTESQQIWHNLSQEILSHPLLAALQKILFTQNWQETTVAGQWLLREQNLAQFLTLLLLSCPKELYKTLNSELLHQIYQMRDLEKLPPLMRQEVAKLREQMSALQELLSVSS